MEHTTQDTIEALENGAIATYSGTEIDKAGGLEWEKEHLRRLKQT